MPTNKVKHEMLRLAKKIVNTEFSDYYVRNPLGNVEKIIPASEMKDGAIKKVLSDHPEFDANTFRGMIKEIQVRNKQNVSAD